jgi:hypothetical protein
MNKKIIGAIAVVAIAATAIVAFNVKDSASDAANNSQIQPIADIASIAELPSRVKDIRALAWQKLTANRDSAYVSQIEVEALISPNSLDCSKELIEVVQGVERIFQGVKLPTKVYLFIGNTNSDMKWFESETRKRLDKKFLSFQGSQMINPETVNDQGEGFIWADDPCNSNLDISGEDKNRVAHGFLHVLQTNQFVNKERDWARWGEVPRWILEGGATVAGNYYAHGDELDAFIKRPENFYELYQFGGDFIKDFMKYTPGEYQPWRHTDQWDNYRAYDVGLYICEILVALRGPDSIINLYGDYLETGDFDESFANIYGTSWTQAYPILSKVTYDVIEDSTKLVMPYLFTEKKSA